VAYFFGEFLGRPLFLLTGDFVLLLVEALGLGAFALADDGDAFAAFGLDEEGGLSADAFFLEGKAEAT